MGEQDRGPNDIGTADRIGILAAATADAVKHKAKGEHETEEGARQTVATDQVETVI